MIPRNHFTKRHFDLGLPFEERMIKRTEYGNASCRGENTTVLDSISDSFMHGLKLIRKHGTNGWMAQEYKKTLSYSVSLTDSSATKQCLDSQVSTQTLQPQNAEAGTDITVR